MKPIRHSTIFVGLSLALVFTMGCGMVDQIKSRVADKVGEVANEAVEKALESAEGLDVEEMLDNAVKCSTVNPWKMEFLLTPGWRDCRATGFASR